MKKIIKDSLALFLITVIAGVILGMVYKITKEPIEQQNEKTKIAAYNSIFDKLDSYEAIEDLTAAQKAVDDGDFGLVVIDEAVRAYDADKKELGTIITVTDKEGYGGDIKFTLGIDTEGTITGLEILSISETAGLGMKAQTDASFRKQFIGINAETVEFVKNKPAQKADNQIDAISSATITTTAITNGVNGGLAAYRALGGVSNE